MEKTIEVSIDIDDVWAEMSSKERSEFIKENLSEADDSDLRDHCINDGIVGIDDFGEDDIIDYLEGRGYYVTQNPPTE